MGCIRGKLLRAPTSQERLTALPLKAMVRVKVATTEAGHSTIHLRHTPKVKNMAVQHRPLATDSLRQDNTVTRIHLTASTASTRSMSNIT